MPRHMFDGDVPKEIQLHVFADASEKAYGAVAYIRASLKDGRIIVRLLCAKSRVSPLKRQTLPRLELCAAVIAAELAQRVRVDLNIQNESVYLWTDSEIVLSWINAQSSSLKTFVANRLSAIQSLSIRNQWRHVRSIDNPADIVSRGLPAVDLPKCQLWFHGPLFLHGKESLWPQKYNSSLAIPTDIEKKATIATAVEQDAIIYKVHHGGSFKRLQRIIGYFFRFVNNTRIPKHKRNSHISLTPKELDESLYVIIRRIQRSEFYDDIKQLQKSHEVDKRSCINALSPYLDPKGIIRVGGRLGNSDLHEDVKQPMENKHCGPQALLNTVRQRFWPVKGKITPRSVVQKCVRCTRAKPQLCQQIMGDLTQTRVVPARPFINSGVDYCGPFWIHHRTVHLELVSNLSTSAFIGALKRFIARRGHCQNIYSDNATNFVGAKNQLSELAEAIHSPGAQNI
ncbi:uncharacterized protein LOC142224632 [Haematobia irritans]|uniref:uncharacterized protein LOC142224632 n=1 Tax=Haematobia irritans TaxID=7368 RepID=UPI003F4F4F23